MKNFFDKIQQINDRHKSELEKLHSFIVDRDVERLGFTLEGCTDQALVDSYVIKLTAEILKRQSARGWDSEEAAISAERANLINELIISTVEASSGSSFQLLKREKYREAIALILRQVGAGSYQDWKPKGDSQ